jgi:hypothetical protein
MKNITVFTIVITALMSAPTGVSSPSRNAIAAFPISTCPRRHHVRTVTPAEVRMRPRVTTNHEEQRLRIAGWTSLRRLVHGRTGMRESVPVNEWEQ